MLEFRKLIIMILFFQPLIALAGEITVDSVSPVVIETNPKAGELSVDVSVDEVRVTFSKDMMTEQMWSVLVVDGGLFPKVSGDPKYINKRTFVMPVKLEPNKTYAMRFNSNKGKSFKDISGKSAESYLLVFKTK